MLSEKLGRSASHAASSRRNAWRTIFSAARTSGRRSINDEGSSREEAGPAEQLYRLGVRMLAGDRDPTRKTREPERHRGSRDQREEDRDERRVVPEIQLKSEHGTSLGYGSNAKTLLQSAFMHTKRTAPLGRPLVHITMSALRPSLRWRESSPCLPSPAGEPGPGCTTPGTAAPGTARRTRAPAATAPGQWE